MNNARHGSESKYHPENIHNKICDNDKSGKLLTDKATETETSVKAAPARHLHHPWSIGDFYVGDLIGQGCFGQVFHGRFKSAQTRCLSSPSSSPVSSELLNNKSIFPNHHDVAIKVMDKQDIMKKKRSQMVLTEKYILSAFAMERTESNNTNSNNNEQGGTLLPPSSSSSTTSSLAEAGWVVHMYMSFVDSQNLYIVMELCTGGDLASLVLHRSKQLMDEENGKQHKMQSFSVGNYECSKNSTRRQRKHQDDHGVTPSYAPSCLDLASVQYFGGQILLALEFLHSRGIVHCDLKPENILLSNTITGRIKLIDFATSIDVRGRICKMRSKQKFSPMKVPSFVGTADYVSPEVIRGSPCRTSTSNYSGDEKKNNASDEEYPMEAIDLWAYGCIIHFMFVGKSPFHSESDYITFNKIIEYVNIRKDNDIESLSLLQCGPTLLPSEIENIIHSLLHYNPCMRLGSGDHVTEKTGKEYSLIRSHPFFNGLDWEGLNKNSMKAPSNCLPSSPKWARDLKYTNVVTKMKDGASLGFDFFE